MAWYIRIAFQSEAMLSSGQGKAGETDLDLVYDENGFPYYKGKTLKGKLREQADVIARHYGQIEMVSHLFGQSYMRERSAGGLLKIGNAYLPHEWYEQLAELDQEQLRQRLTSIRAMTAMDNNTGVAKEGSLRQVRVLTKDIVFYSEIDGVEELTEEQRAFCALVISMTKHIGSLQTRGKGQVSMQLYHNDQDVTSHYLDEIKWGNGV